MTLQMKHRPRSPKEEMSRLGRRHATLRHMCCPFCGQQPKEEYGVSFMYSHGCKYIAVRDFYGGAEAWRDWCRETIRVMDEVDVRDLPKNGVRRDWWDDLVEADIA